MTILNAKREDYILGAAGLSGTKSPWLVYHILQGTQIDQVERPAPIMEHFKQSMIDYAERQYRAKIITDDICTTFSGDFDIEPYLRVDEPGDLPCNSGDVLMIEMLELNTLRYVWKVNYDLVLPWTIQARANIRMHAAGAKGAVVWVISDQGATDEMHHVAYDERLVRRLMAACRSMAQRVAKQDEPDPSDEDLLGNVDFHELMGDGANSTRQVAETEELAKTFQLYQQLTRETSAAARAKSTAEKALKPLKAKLLRELDKTPRLVFPDGTSLTVKTVKVKERQQDGYQWQKLITVGENGEEHDE